ncbi:MAG: hypothetical protein ACNI28_09120 [Arcobacter sp.]|uniref:hypothetical protein n=1 Tax=Arcobacter sp. TaxID=1872629 RepID=UPI003B00FF31
MPFDIPTFNKDSIDINNAVIEKNTSQFENKINIEKQENDVKNIVLKDIEEE